MAAVELHRVDVTDPAELRVVYTALPVDALTVRVASTIAAAAFVTAALAAIMGLMHFVVGLLAVAVGMGAMTFERVRRLQAPMRERFGRVGRPLADVAEPAEVAAWAVYNHLRYSFLERRDRGGRWGRILLNLGPWKAMMPSTAVDRSFQHEIGAIPAIEELVEPELIAQSVAASKFSTARRIATSGLFMIVGFAFRQWIFVVLGGTLALLGALTHPWMKERFPVLRLEFGAPIAAPGVIKDSKGRTWSRGYAMMVVQRPLWGRGLVVTMIGPEGLLRMMFAGARDRDFVMLWQRWNHPRPRPELMSE
ncbi:MAG TPA: hypothetical protein VG797_11030 [Phycisphaerales bacterium]|nr:hypothetical protein [Phycisphaerales bacterium]